MPRWPGVSKLDARSWIRREFLLLVVVCLASAAVFVVAVLADEVMEGETHAFDTALLLALRTPGDPSNPIGPWWLQVMVRDITSLGGTTVVTLVTVLALGYLVLERKYATALLVLASIGGGAAVSTVLKTVVARPRPDLVSHLVDVQTLSFPSGHATLSAITYLTLGALLAREQRHARVRIYLMAVAIAMTLAIGCSRVYLGVHWPTDVLAGWCVGAAWAMLWWILARIVSRAKTGAGGERETVKD